MDATVEATLAGILDRLRTAGWKEREGIKGELLALAGQVTSLPAFRERLEGARKELSLELRWEIDEVLEAIAPPPAPPPAAPPEPEPPPAPEEPKGPQRLSSADLNLVYDDPRGLMLYKTKKPPERWFATQVDPRSGQPQTFELHPQEVSQLKLQLAGSPYWVLGSGEAAAR
jgi:hypothetical protein